MQDDPLAQRLATLELHAPPDLVTHVLAAARPQRRRAAGRPLWANLGMAGVLLIGALMATTYFAPRFQQALADSPFIGPALAPLMQGFEPLSGRFQDVHAVSSSAGYQLQVVAAYADQNETYLAVRLTPVLTTFPREFPGDATLTDQFGRTLALRGGSSDARTGTAIWNFAGVGWPDTSVGARLMLHVHALEVATDQPREIRGDWVLHLTVGVEPSKPYTGPLPADGQLGNSTVRFTQVQAGAATVRVQMHISEPLSKKLGETVGSVVPGVSKPHPAFDVRLLASDGSVVQPLGEETGSSLAGAEVTQTWLRPAPGAYRLVVSYEGIGQVARDLPLP